MMRNILILFGVIIPFNLFAQVQIVNPKIEAKSAINFYHVQNDIREFEYDAPFAAFLNEITPKLSGAQENHIIANLDWFEVYFIRKGAEYINSDSLKFNFIKKLVQSEIEYSKEEGSKIIIAWDFLAKLSPEIRNKVAFIPNTYPTTSILADQPSKSRNVFFILTDILQDLDGLSINTQIQIDAIKAIRNYSIPYSAFDNSSNLGNQQILTEGTLSSAFDIQLTFAKFIDSIDVIHHEINDKLKLEKKRDWNEFYSLIKYYLKNQIILREYTYYIFSDDAVNSLTDDLLFVENRMNSKAMNFWLLYNEGNFLDTTKILDKIGVSTRQIIKNYYPNLTTSRTWVRFVDQNKVDVKIDTLKKTTLDEMLSKDTVGIQLSFVHPDSIESSFKLKLDDYFHAALTDTTVDNEEYYPSFSNKLNRGGTVNVEPFLIKYYPNTKEVNEVLQSANQQEIDNIYSFGLTLAISNSPGYRQSSLNRYLISYSRSISMNNQSQMVNSYWGDCFGFATENMIINKRFASLSLISRYAYMRNVLTLGEVSTVTDPFIINPQSLYQVKRNSQMGGFGLNVKVGLNKFYLNGEVGYMWDFSDDRWKYLDNYINGKGRMTNKGLYVSVGLGINLFNKANN